jgi:hypothetical protein
LARLKEDLIGGAGDVDEAVTTLDRLQEMVAGLTEAKGTLGDIQHMVVDVMLLRPAVDRAVQTLKPVIDFTRTARAVDPAVRAIGSVPAPAAEIAKPAADATKSATVTGAPAEVVDVARTIGDVPQ